MWSGIVNGFGWVMMRLYELTQNYGLALIIFTLITKLILLPFAAKSRKSLMKMTKFTPKMKELEAKYKDDKEKYNLELQKLYKQEKVNPLSGCLWTLIPFPLLIALYGVVRLPLSRMLHLTDVEVEAVAGALNMAANGATQLDLASQLTANLASVKAALPDIADKLRAIDFSFLGMDMSLTPSYSVLNWYFLLPILSAVLAYMSSFIMQKMQSAPADQQQSNKFMTFLGPIFSLWIGFSMPSAMSLYWIANSVFTITQEAALTVYYRKKLGILSPRQQREEDARIKAEEERRAAERAERRRVLSEGGAAPNRAGMSSKKYKQLKAQQAQKSAGKAIPAPGDTSGEDSDLQDDTPLDDTPSDNEENTPETDSEAGEE